jgi:alkanesulfonate monooxygenase SsuD/methylene tetrahydromethanopterin reductase-like flavin-dependent oxidoreductase (luciferase family)
MQFGLLYEAQRPFKGTNVDWNTLYKETLEQCVLAEKAGFDNLWFVEHLALHSIEMFGKHVIPAGRARVSAKPVPAGI